MEMTANARSAWSWIQANRHSFVSDITEPWVVSAPDTEIEDFLARSYANGELYDNIKDNLMFNFHSSADYRLFRQQGFVTMLALFGDEYLQSSVRRDT
jgi:hypothetical protein